VRSHRDKKSTESRLIKFATDANAHSREIMIVPARFSPLRAIHGAGSMFGPPRQD
jgi:hypothetical protein